MNLFQGELCFHTLYTYIYCYDLALSPQSSLKPVFSGLVAASSQALTKVTDTGAQQFCGSGQEFIHLDMDLKC